MVGCCDGLVWGVGWGGGGRRRASKVVGWQLATNGLMLNSSAEAPIAALVLSCWRVLLPPQPGLDNALAAVPACAWLLITTCTPALPVGPPVAAAEQPAWRLQQAQGPWQACAGTGCRHGPGWHGYVTAGCR